MVVIADAIVPISPVARVNSVMTAAADAVELWPLLDRLGGWDAVVRPVSLSAADRQLIGLARAYASPARLVVLDEAGCHLDRRQQEFVEESFRDRAGSLIVIGPTTESARRAERILVLDGRAEELEPGEKARVAAI